MADGPALRTDDVARRGAVAARALARRGQAQRRLGGAYLIWFGARLLRAGAVPQASAPERPGAPFVIGLATALSNAQAVFFITSIFAVAGVINANAATGAAVVAVLVCCNGLYLGFLGWLLLKPGPRRAYERWRATMQRLFGALFMVFGGQLVWKAIRG